MNHLQKKAFKSIKFGIGGGAIGSFLSYQVSGDLEASLFAVMLSLVIILSISNVFHRELWR